MIIRKSIEIDAPPDAVFAVIRDPDNDPTWCPTVLESEQVEGSGPEPGAIYNQVHKPGPAKPTPLAVEIMEVEAPHRMQLRSTDELGVFDVGYELVALPDGGTRLTQVDDIDFRGFAKLLQPIMFFAIHSGIKQQFAGLKAMLEDDAARDRTDA